MAIVYETGYLQTAYLSAYNYLSGQIGYGASMQVAQFVVDRANPRGIQVEGIVDDSTAIGQQTLMTIEDIKAIGIQVAMEIVDHLHNVGFQAELFIKDDTTIGFQVKGVINDTVQVGQQVAMYIVERLNLVGLQSEMIIKDDKAVGIQVLEILKDEKQVGQQANMQIIDIADDPHVGFQVLMSIPNFLKPEYRLLYRP